MSARGDDWKTIDVPHSKHAGTVLNRLHETYLLEDNRIPTLTCQIDIMERFVFATGQAHFEAETSIEKAGRSVFHALESADTPHAVLEKVVRLVLQYLDEQGGP